MTGSGTGPGGDRSGLSLARPVPPAVVAGLGAIAVVAMAVACYLVVVDDGASSVETDAGPPLSAPAVDDPGPPAVARSLEAEAPGGRELLRVQPVPGSIDAAAHNPTPTTAEPPTSGPESVPAPPSSQNPSTTAPPTSTTGVPAASANPSSTAQPATASAATASAAAATGEGGGAQAAPCKGNGRFERVFRDDFNGGSVGPAWRQYDSIGNNGYGLRRPSAITVADGNLVITAQMVDGRLVSGGMAHNYDQTYGKYVVRVRTEEDPSVTVSGVVLTWPLSQVHPRDGENNIYETLVYDADRSPFYSVIHKPYGTKSDQELRVHSADGTAFQAMTMEWTPEGITITREGPGVAPVETWTVTETAEDLIPDVAHHVTIQLDAWKQTIPGPVRMEVDFIEVHRYCG